MLNLKNRNYRSFRIGIIILFVLLLVVPVAVAAEDGAFFQRDDTLYEVWSTGKVGTGEVQSYTLNYLHFKEISYYNDIESMSVYTSTSANGIQPGGTDTSGSTDFTAYYGSTIIGMGEISYTKSSVSNTVTLTFDYWNIGDLTGVKALSLDYDFSFGKIIIDDIDRSSVGSGNYVAWLSYSADAGLRPESAMEFSIVHSTSWSCKIDCAEVSDNVNDLAVTRNAASTVTIYTPVMTFLNNDYGADNIDVTVSGKPIYCVVSDPYGQTYYKTFYAEEFANFAGTVYDMTTGEAIPSATITAKQESAGSWIAVGEGSSTSTAEGAYEILGVPIQTETQISASKTGYETSEMLWTPPWGDTTWQYDLYMYPDGMTYNGSAIGGQAYEMGSGTGINGATVNIWNATWNDSTTSNSVGYYIFDELADNSTYYLNATHLDYTAASDSTATTETDTFVEKDLALRGSYELNVIVRESDSEGLVTNSTVSVSVSDGQSGTTTDGTASFYVTWGTYTVTANCEGYYASSEYVAVDQDATVTIYLTKEIEGGLGTYYSPHQVRFTVRDFFGNGIENVTVTAIGTETTVGPWDWLMTLFGISEETPIYNESMEGTTDSEGRISFMMIESVKYEMTFDKTGVIDEDLTLYPSDDSYIIYASGNNEWFNTGYNALNVTNVSVTTTEIDDDSATISVSYYDYLSHTTSVSIWINQTNSSAGWGGAQTNLNYSTIADDSDFTQNFTVYDYAGESYLVFVSGTQTDIGDWDRTFSVMFPDEPVSFGLPTSVLPWVAFFIMMFTMLLFGALSATQGTVIIAFEGWLFYALGWFADFGNMIVLPLIFATVVAILANVMKRSKQERFI